MHFLSDSTKKQMQGGEKWWIEGDIPDLEWEDKQISFQYNLF